MPNISPADAANKWASRLSGSTQEITAAVQAVRTAPGALAARNVEAWAQRTIAAKQKWARNVAAVSLPEWQDKMINVGIPRIASGAEANKGKWEAFANDFFPHLEAGVQKVKAMPNNNIEDGIQRAVAMIRHNSSFVRRGRNAA